MQFILTSNRGNANYFFIIAIALTALIVGVLFYNKQTFDAQQKPEFQRLILLPTTRHLSPVELIDHSGDKFTLDDFKGQWSLLFFGFTHCPDICPSTLMALKNTRRDLEKQGQWPDINVYMVSVDPNRDTPERLNQYVPFFHPEFTGLTGEVDAITQFAKEVGILFMETQIDESGYYEVDHGVSMILLNPSAQYAGVITAPHEPSTLARDLGDFHRYLSRSNPASALQPSATPDETTADSEHQSTTQSTNVLRTDNAWVRLGPPNARAHAGYVSLQNSGTDPVTILAVETPTFEMSELHSTEISEGTARMQAIEQLVIEPNSSVALEPFGHHLMLMMPTTKITEHDLIPITLKTDQGDISFVAEVLKDQLQ